MQTNHTVPNAAKTVGKWSILTGALVLAMLAGAVSNADNNKKPETNAGAGTGVMRQSMVNNRSEVLSVAAVRKSRDGKTVQVLFNEREQIFTIDASVKGGPAALAAKLEEALKSGQPLTVVSDEVRASIKSVAKPAESEMGMFRYLRKEVLKSAKPKVIDLKKIEKIDTSEFNNIEKLKFPVWKLCAKTVPNYAKAKEIFDYCAKQSCNLPGPFDITPCIPFQYVRDGCYARAHKMKWIISEHFGYCNEKVFSFANNNIDQLAVVASKWGGCCVTWWYHVAPVIRVNSTIVLKGKSINLVLAYVIDPGMFDKPVLLSTWLQAQANATCSPHAKVTSYTIQPASAYSPANYAGTAFTTDPLYTATNATLINYQHLVTCY